MLTATETLRVEKFTAGMDAVTAQAIFHLFNHSKTGCDEATYDLMDAAHHPNQKVSARTLSTFSPYGLVLPSGDIPKAVKTAVRKAVALRFLIMHDPAPPTLELRSFDCE